MPRLHVAIVADYPEEGWPSMDLMAEMVPKYLAHAHGDEIEATRVCPPYRRRLGRLPGPRLAGVARNADRVLNRFVDYPRHLRRLARRGPFDVYHIIDHSYAQLVLVLPPGRAVVTCHDVDAFRCLIRPDLEPRPAWFRALARRALRGLRAAAAVSCVSEATRSALLEHRLVPADRLTVNYQGVAPEFTDSPDPESDAEVAGLVGAPGSPELLHVGTTIPRKRIDVLLDVFAGICRARPGAILIKAGGRLTPEQADRAGRWASPTRSARCPSSRAAGRSPPSIAARPWCSSRARPRGSACPWPRRWPAARRSWLATSPCSARSPAMSPRTARSATSQPGSPPRWHGSTRATVTMPAWPALPSSAGRRTPIGWSICIALYRVVAGRRGRRN